LIACFQLCRDIIGGDVDGFHFDGVGSVSVDKAGTKGSA
jgi:hypothetical protein